MRRRKRNQDFDDFFRREYPELVAALTVAGGGVASAEDAAQEAFIAAFKKWREVSAMENPEGWVRTVGARRMIDAYRRSAAHERTARRLVVDVSGGRTESLVDLEREVSELPVKQRSAFVLHYFEDLPVDQVAQLLECSPGTIKSNLADARKNLSRSLTSGHGQGENEA